MTVNVKFSELSKNFDVTLSASSKSFDVSLGKVHEVTRFIGGDTYTGSYTVTPKVEAQTMPTKDKAMANDVTIKAIPVYNVSNPSGGTTFYIATMDE